MMIVQDPNNQESIRLRCVAKMASYTDNLQASSIASESSELIKLDSGGKQTLQDCNPTASSGSRANLVRKMQTSFVKKAIAQKIPAKHI